MNDVSNIKLDDSQTKTLAEKFGLSPLIVDILVKRGFDDFEKINNFLNVDQSQLNDPFLLKNMDVVCNRIKLALNKNESIVVFGDYDVDGISASYILWDYLKKLNANVNYFLPCRIADGYGLTNSTIDQVNQQFNPSLIITVDCGISCYKEVLYAQSLGIEVLVTDHHEIPEITPEIFVNAKAENQEYPFRDLCGAGMAFKIVQALGGIEVAKKYLPVAAIATVADIVPLVLENRAIVKLGFELEKHLPKGIKKLIKQCGVSTLSAKEISFKVAPKINAPGRMGDCLIAMKLFVEQDDEKINKLIDEIFVINEQRQKICNQMYDECKEMLKSYDIKNKKFIILKSKNQDKGLLGIIAARLSFEFGRPAIIFNEDEEILKGSCRSIEGVNCVKLFESCKELLDGFGGHSMAGGLSIQLKNFDSFCQKCEEFVDNNDLNDCFKSVSKFDLEVNVNKLNSQFAKQIELLEPTGCENKNPVFKINFSNCFINQNKNYPNHFYVKIGGMDFTAFNFLGHIDSLKSTSKKNALVEIGIETFRGKTDIKRYLKSVELVCSPTEKDYKFYSLNCLEPNFDDLNCVKISKDELLKLKENRLGNLFVVGSEREFDFAKENLDFANFENFRIANISPASTVISAPIDLDNFECFKNIIFLNKIPAGFLIKLNEKLKDNISKSNIYYCDEVASSKWLSFDLKRETFASYFVAIKNEVAKKQNFLNLKDFIFSVKYGNISQLMFCFSVFRELNIIEVNTENGFKILINSKKKNDLESSLIYKNIKGIYYGN